MAGGAVRVMNEVREAYGVVIPPFCRCAAAVLLAKCRVTRQAATKVAPFGRCAELPRESMRIPRYAGYSASNLALSTRSKVNSCWSLLGLDLTGETASIQNVGEPCPSDSVPHSPACIRRDP